jgi:hypothetical protein
MPGNTVYCLAKGGRVLRRTAGTDLAKHSILVVGV